MGTSLLLALGLMLVVEGILPFIAPKVWRETFIRVTAFKDGQLRFLGMASMLLGLILLWVSR
ncbi:MAG TPA: DUF2065 domain-containing protein [Rhodocyclaceae bacterium]